MFYLCFPNHVSAIKQMKAYRSVCGFFRFWPYEFVLREGRKEGKSKVNQILLFVVDAFIDDKLQTA